jgi:8-oxo-dGTP pyrophosphatase MutT (NUDIX family)
VAGRFVRLDEQVVYTGSLIRVVHSRFRGPQGETFTRDVVRHPGAVVVVPLVDDETVLLVRQFRAAIGAELLELPAGKRDVEGEPPEATAARELVEEAGREAGTLELLARFHNSPGFSDELSWLYLATGLRAVADNRQGVEEQAMTLQEVRLADVDRMVAAGELLDAKTILGLSLVRLRTAGNP